MKQLVLATVAVLLSGCAASLPGVVPPTTKASEAEMIQLAVEVIFRHNQAIQEFASLAAQSDIESLMNLFVPAMKATMGENTLRNELKRVIVPFFADYEKIFSGAVNPATFPDGRKGSAHYTYIMTKSGDRKPLTLWLLIEGDQALVGFIEVDRCVRGRHPVCDGQVRTE